MKTISKRVSNLTEVQYAACYRLNYGSGGYMRDFLRQHKNDKNSYAILIWNEEKDRLDGWALLVPIETCGGWGPTRYSRNKCKFALQFYVRASERRKGLGGRLMMKALKIDPSPFVWPHDIPSGKFFKSYPVVMNKWERDYYVRRKVA